jgi:hypothetical protein
MMSCVLLVRQSRAGNALFFCLSPPQVSAGQKNSPSSLARFIEVGIIVTQNMVSGIEVRYIFGYSKQENVRPPERGAFRSCVPGMNNTGN